MDRTLATIPRLTNYNYHDWKFAVSMALRLKDCWEVIADGEDKKPAGDALAAWTKKSNEALTIIALTVDPSQYTYIRDCTDGVTAWKKLKDVYEKNSRATRISLKRQFYTFDHDINVPMQRYVNGITDLAAKLNGIGVTLTDEDITDVLIFNLDNEYSSIAASLTASKSDLTSSDVISALLEEEQRKGGAPELEIGSALYGNGFDNTSRGPPGRRGPNRESRERDDGPRINRKCYRCGRKGHMSRECRATKTIDGQAITPEMEREAEQSTNAYDVNWDLNNSEYTY